jgi:hypothetical protein
MLSPEVEALLMTQRIAFEGSLKAFLDSVNTRIDSVLAQVVEVKTTLTSALQRLDKLESTDKALKEEFAQIEESVHDLDEKADYLENQSRRNNLRVDGIPEAATETWEVTEAAVRCSLIKDLGLPFAQADALKIERAHRTGRRIKNKNKPRPIVVKFLSFKDRELILKRARAIKPNGVKYREDFSSRIIHARIAQQAELVKQRSLGKIAYFSYDKLIVHNRRPSGFGNPSGPSSPGRSSSAESPPEDLLPEPASAESSLEDPETIPKEPSSSDT